MHMCCLLDYNTKQYTIRERKRLTVVHKNLHEKMKKKYLFHRQSYKHCCLIIVPKIFEECSRIVIALTDKATQFIVYSGCLLE